MFLILAGFVGLLAASLNHWFTWTLRLKAPVLTIALGVSGALVLTGFCLLYLTSDIRNLVLVFLAILWAVALLLGALQAFALKISWWRGVLGVFFEMALAFLVGSAVNLTLQKYIPWFDEHFPGVDVYAVINSFLWTMIITLLVLAIVRPLLARKNSPD